MASSQIEALDAAETVENGSKNAEGRALGRRHFLAALGMVGAAAGAGLMSGCSTSSTVTPAANASSVQLGILNFLLNVKYLQATFYSFVTQGIDLTGINSNGSVTGAPSVITFTGTNAKQITDMFDEIYFDEKNQVSALVTLLGASAVARPAINLAAYGAINATTAIAVARMLEDVAVTAYAGVVTSLSNSSVTVTSQIFGADGFHAGALRLASIQNAVTNIIAGPLDVPPYDPQSATVAAAGPSTNGGFFGTAGASTSTSTNPAGFAFARTTSQVLAILFGAPGKQAGSGTNSGGFFPSGISGDINQV